jgi:hypothetical protein
MTHTNRFIAQTIDGHPGCHMGIYDLWNHQFAALVCEGTDTALILDALNEKPRFVSALRTARAVLIPAALFGDEATVDALRAVNGALKGTEE